MGVTYDFSGYATKNDIKCSDGRTIRKNAFIENDGQTVPLVWQHQHNDPMNVLGHALLENRDDGVYAYITCNDTPAGKHAKEMVRHGDVVSLSIYANKLKQHGGDVLHGAIREVSLVLAGANPGALIDFPIIAHSGEEAEDEAIIYTDELVHMNSENETEEKSETEKEEASEESNDLQHAEPIREEGDVVMPEGNAPQAAPQGGEKTVQDVFNELTEEQKNVVYFMIGQALEDAGVPMDDEEGETEEMKHNVFDADARQDNYLSHADMETILSDAKKIGSLKEAVEYHQENGVLAHALPSPIPTDGMEGPSNTTVGQTYGVRDLDMLFPEYKSLNNPPEWIKRDTGWVDKVMKGVHHTPFSRIKSQYANITEDDARARGYMKGNLKREEVFTLLKRTTSPQTVYKKQKLDKDDITDITDFNVVSWIKGEMRLMLDEEIARAILIGDGRANDSDDKIKEDHIRPIAKDVDLFNVKVNVNVAGNATNGEKAQAFIDEVIRARKYYKGSGNPKLFTTADMLTEMLLIKDGIGHPMYKSISELATTLRVSEIVEVEVMEGQKINTRDLVGIIVNLDDYNVGADKGGSVDLFDDFDIDYNQYKYLIETRCSGALIKPFSAMTVTMGTSN